MGCPIPKTLIEIQIERDIPDLHSENLQFQLRIAALEAMKKIVRIKFDEINLRRGGVVTSGVSPPLVSTLPEGTLQVKS